MSLVNGMNKIHRLIRIPTELFWHDKGKVVTRHNV